MCGTFLAEELAGNLKAFSLTTVIKLLIFSYCFLFWKAIETLLWIVSIYVVVITIRHYRSFLNYNDASKTLEM